MLYIIAGGVLLILLWILSYLYGSRFMFRQIRNGLVDKRKTLIRYKEKLNETKNNSQKVFNNEYFLDSILMVEEGLNDFLDYYDNYERLLDHLCVEEKQLKQQRKYLEIGKYLNKKISLYASILNRTEHIVLFYGKIVNIYTKMTNDKNFKEINKFDEKSVKEMRPTIDNFKNNYNRAILTIRNY